MAKSPPIDVEKLAPSNPRARLVRRSDVDIKTPGATLVQLLQSGSDVVVLQSSGVDSGSGVVVLGLSATGVVAGTYNNFSVDRYGRITKAWLTAAATGGGSSTSAIQNQTTYEQSASFWIGGSARIGGQVTAGSISVGDIAGRSLTLSTPLSVSSGGTAVATTQANYVFAGPGSGTVAPPTFRTLVLEDLPTIPWSKLSGTPTTVAGYGIVDVYSKAQADEQFLVVGMGTTTQWLRGDHQWFSLTPSDVSGLTGWATHTFTTGTTSDIAEGTNLYFTVARAQAAAASALTPTLPIQINAGTISHSNADGYMHVPATGTTSLGKVLKAGATAGVFVWDALHPNDIAGLTSWASHAYVDGTTTDIPEGTQLYFTLARVRNAISLGSSSNLTYSSTTGVLDMTPTPVFDSVTLNNSPTQANQATTKQYVDGAVRNGATWTAIDKIPVQNAATYSYSLAFTPIQDTTEVSLNGLALFAGATEDYTITGATITLNASLMLTVGDVVHVKYKH